MPSMSVVDLKKSFTFVEKLIIYSMTCEHGHRLTFTARVRCDESCIEHDFEVLLVGLG